MNLPKFLFFFYPCIFLCKTNIPLTVDFWNPFTCISYTGMSIIYSTVSARQLLFVWCSLSDNRQTIARCLSDVPSDICQFPPDICQTSTTYTPDMYCTICTPDVHQTYTYTRHPPDMSDMWYMSGAYMWYLSDRCLVGVDRCLMEHLAGIWQPSVNHLTGSTRQIATVWWKQWCRYIAR